MYKLINVNQDDVVLDAACGSGAFLVKSMCNMIKEAGGVSTIKSSKIKTNQLYGIEFDRQIYALACANMLIHKDGKTNIEHLDTRTNEACEWIKDKPITKVLMNPPFENKYGCMDIVSNVLDNVPVGKTCAFILPDKKLERVGKKGPDLLKKHSLKKIIKLSEKTFFEGVTTSVFVFEAGKPQNDEEIFACYIEEDGLETVRNQGRQDTRDKWNDIESYWLDVIKKQSGNDTIQWIKPSEHLSYQLPKPKFEIFEEDFIKTVMDYYMFEENIDVKSFRENVTDKVLYSGNVRDINNKIYIQLPKNNGGNNEND
jgi:type I restriction-modification system DNA methylase subunit